MKTNSVKKRSLHIGIRSAHRIIVGILVVAMIAVFGAGQIKQGFAATAPSGSFTCASNTTNITLVMNWANAPGGVEAWRYGMSTPLYKSKTVTASNVKTDGNAQNTSNATFLYELRLLDATGKIVSKIDHNCSTKPKPATVSLSCKSVTTSSITVNVTYNNPDLGTNLYMNGTLAITYPKGSATTTRTQQNLAASTNYTFKLDPGAAGTAVQVVCTTAAPPPPATPTPDPTPPPDTGGSTDTSGDTTDSTDNSTDYSNDPVAVDSGTEGIDVIDSGSTSDGSDSANIADGVTLNDDSSASDTAGDTSNASASSASGSSKNLNGKKTNVLKATLSALGVIAMLVVGFFGWLIIRGRHLDAAQAYDYDTQAIAMPQAVAEPYTAAAPPPLPVPAPAASNQMESIINSTFYPGQPQPVAPTEPATAADEPLDMFEVASQYPTSFGNSHNILPNDPVPPTVVTPTAAPAPTTIPLPPMPAPTPPVEQASDGSISIPHDNS